MFLLTLARIGGIFVVVLFAFVAIVCLVQREWLAGAMTAFIAIGGLALSLAADKRMKRRRAEREAEEAVGTAAFTASALTVRLRWLKMLGLVAVGVLLGVPMLLLAWTQWHGGKTIAPLAIGAAGLLFLFFGLGFLSVAARAAARGYLIQLDLLGLAHCALPTIAWRHVHGIDLQEVANGKQKHWILKLGLDAGAMGSLRPPAWRRWFDLGVPRFDMQRQIVSIGLPFADVQPAELLVAARAIADGANAPRIADWFHFEDMPTALARTSAKERADNAQREVDRLLARLKTSEGQAAPSADERRAIEAKVKASLDDMGKASTEALEARRKTLDKQLRTMRQTQWAVYVMVALGAVFIIGKVAIKAGYL